MEEFVPLEPSDTKDLWTKFLKYFQSDWTFIKESPSPMYGNTKIIRFLPMDLSPLVGIKDFMTMIVI